MKSEWRCEKCNTLLGIDRGEHLSLRYKDLQLIVTGGDYHIIAVCRKCATASQRTSEDSSTKRTAQLA